MTVSAPLRRRSTLVGIAALLLFSVVQPTASGHPGQDHGTGAGVFIRVAGPAEVGGDIPALHWDSGPIEGVDGPLVYVGTGCTPASYLDADVAGKIVVTDQFDSRQSPADLCPAYLVPQKVMVAEQQGAIGFIQISAEGNEPTADTPTESDIPALDVAFEHGDALASFLADGGAASASFHVANPPIELDWLVDQPCVDGLSAALFPCNGIDLLSFVPKEAFGGIELSDLWGWVDQASGREFVMLGKLDGVAFFEITDPRHPRHLGSIGNPAVEQTKWFDIKVYADHAFIVSESTPHGMLIVDLRQLLTIDGDDPVTIEPAATYDLNVSAHNIAIDTDTGYAYIVGGNEYLVPDQCLSGLHIVDIRNPVEPAFAGCYLIDGGPSPLFGIVGAPVSDLSPAAYVHDTQCVVYHGPDEVHAGKEICVNSSEDQVVIADVTDKMFPSTIGLTDYPDVSYSHQGWLTEDHRYFVANDELDEETNGHDTRTLVFDVQDLDAPTFAGAYMHDTTSIDHNSYIRGGFAFQSNYTTGLRILDLADIGAGDGETVPLRTTAFFDTFPAHDDPTFEGTWSNYPYFPSGTIAVSGINEGLFLLRPSPGALRD